ncbi:MAG: hypothetical protein U0T82_03320 [Bacteroidales bacterium]
MFEKFPTLILILLSSGLFSQELVTKQKVNLEKFFTEKREAYPVINGNNVSLYLTDPNSISRLSFDLELNQQTIYTWRLPDGPYDLILGGRHTPTNEILFFSDNKRRKLGSIVFPADGASLLVKNIDLDLKNEAFIESFNHGDNFIMLTVIKQTNILRIYSFTNPVDYTVKDINFFDFRFDSGEQYLSDALT